MNVAADGVARTDTGAGASVRDSGPVLAVAGRASAQALDPVLAAVHAGPAGATSVRPSSRSWPRRPQMVTG
ncbi:hypothetical protein ARTHRO9AX_210200 [Arthrobacter sp. 9AX]|nr:hypothetical protein ARTHRO9AX_210200 [Arthrobacter sp. 9AX]